MSLEYERGNVALARGLRRDMTPWERKLWHCFLKKHRLRWQRQKPLLGYIVDFYCGKAKLAVELDGSQHYDSGRRAADENRTRELEGLGIHVQRFANNDVDRRFRAVCESIDSLVAHRLS